MRRSMLTWGEHFLRTFQKSKLFFVKSVMTYTIFSNGKSSTCGSHEPRTDRHVRRQTPLLPHSSVTHPSFYAGTASSRTSLISERALSMKKLNLPDPAPSSIMYKGSFGSSRSLVVALAASRTKPWNT